MNIQDIVDTFLISVYGIEEASESCTFGHAVRNDRKSGIMPIRWK